MPNPNPGSCPICGSALTDDETAVQGTFVGWGTVTLEYYLCDSGDHIIYVETVPPSEDAPAYVETISPIEEETNEQSQP